MQGGELKRFGNEARAAYLAMLRAHSGAFCKECRADETDIDGPLEIDHIDGDPSRDEPGNLQLLCRACNASKGAKAALLSFGDQLPLAVQPSRPRSERDKKDSPSATSSPDPSMPATEAARRHLDYQAGSAEMRANDYYETRFRAWARVTVSDRKATNREPWERAKMIAAGAEVVGCSEQAARGYLNKQTAEDVGELELLRDGVSRRWIVVARRGPAQAPVADIPERA